MLAEKNEGKDDITKNSTSEQIVEFFIQKYNFKKNDLISLIKEDISGDILPYLNKQDLKGIGLKLGHWIKIDKFITDNRDNLLNNQNNTITTEIRINIDSDINSVKAFLEKHLNFKNIKDNFDVDGKKLFSMNEQDMKNLGLTLGQRKKLNLYIQYVLRKKNNYDKVITEKSTSKEVKNFLKDKFNMPENIIEEMALDGESLTLLKEEDIDEIEEIPLYIKNEFKNYIKEINNEKNKENIIKEKEIETQKEYDESNFENKNDNNNNSNEEREIEEIEFKNIETKMNKNFLGEETKKSEIKIIDNNKIIPSKLNKKKRNIIIVDELHKLSYKKNLISKEKEKDEKKEEKKEVKKEEKQNNIEKFEISKNNENEEETTENNLLNKSILKEYKGEELPYIKTFPIKNYEIVPMIDDSKYNLFLFLVINDNFTDKINISFFATGTKIHYKYYFIYEYKKSISRGVLNFILAQIPVQKDLLKITVLFEENGMKIKELLEFENTEENFNYFYLDKIIYPNTNKTDFNINEIIMQYFNFFFDEKNMIEERYKFDLIKYISEKEKLEMQEDIYFKYIKFCLEFNIKPYNKRR